MNFFIATFEKASIFWSTLFDDFWKSFDILINSFWCFLTKLFVQKWSISVQDVIHVQMQAWQKKNFSDILTNQISPFVYSKDTTQHFRQGKITEPKKRIIFHFIRSANQISKSYIRGINLKKRQLFQIKLIVLLNWHIFK